MRRLPFITLIPYLCFASTPNEEALFINRIADFWQEQEYSLAKEQITEFLQTYPESSYKNFLHSAIGDLYLKENDFENALKHYQCIQDIETLQKISTNKWHCLFELQDFETLVSEIKNTLKDPSFKDSDQAELYLASALYHLALQSSDAENPFLNQALKVFEKIYDSNSNTELAPIYAHLLYLSGQNDEAISIYKQLGTDQNNQEMIFQAALLQAETDPHEACKSFEEIYCFDKDGNKSDLQKEALFNFLVLSLDLGNTSFITKNFNEFLKCPHANESSVYLMLAKSFAAENELVQAQEFFLKCIDLENEPSKELESALHEAFQIAQTLKDIDTSSSLLEKMQTHFAQDLKVTNCAIMHSRLLNEMGRFEQSSEILDHLLETGNHLDLVYLELISKSASAQDFASCKEFCEKFREKYPEHPQSLFVEENLAFAFNHILDVASIDQLTKFAWESKFQEIQNLSKFFLAKYWMGQKNFQAASPFLETCIYPEMEGSLALLKAIYHKDANNDLQMFTKFAEMALLKGGVSKGQIHASLFDGYFALKNFEKAKYHLFCAFEENVDLQEESLFWLLDKFYAENDFVKAEKIAAPLFENSHKTCYGKYLAKIYLAQNEFEKALTVLKQLEKEPEPSENSLLIATCHEGLHNDSLASKEYEKILDGSPHFQNFISASACLKYAKLKIQTTNDFSLDNESLRHVLTLLKTMTLQKTHLHEPLYLEAAFTYVDTLAQLHQEDPEKRLSLLTKMKDDFLKEENILEIDYHKMRKQDPKFGEIFSCYMNLLDAEIAAEKSFNQNHQEENICQQECFEALQKIVEKKLYPELTARAERCLQP